ncbi:MAG TPA: SufD family Fe-S cluster assembly protein, partial [Thermoanaerobaculia bacterium]|nr:SufD family Fe-S cluster assembly protein [Thermoanaerobaculia bacterium]
MEAIAEERGFVPAFAERPGEPAWLAELRRAAAERFAALGFPTPHVEEWRYTSVGPIVSTPWVTARAQEGQPAFEGEPPAGVRTARLRELLAKDPEVLRGRVGGIAGAGVNAFAELNAASFQDGLLIEIAPGAVVEAPLEIRFASGGASEPSVSHPRCVLVAGAGSEATVVERYAGTGSYFQNPVTEIFLEDGAVLTHVKLQQEHLAAFHVHTIAVRQERASRFASHNVALGAALARTDLRVTLAAEGAETALYGLFVG